MMNECLKIFAEAHNKALSKVEDKIRELYDKELSDEDKKLISIEEFASYYTIDYEITDENPKVILVLRHKTAEEILEELDMYEYPSG